MSVLGQMPRLVWLLQFLQRHTAYYIQHNMVLFFSQERHGASERETKKLSERDTRLLESQKLLFLIYMLLCTIFNFALF